MRRAGLQGKFAIGGGKGEDCGAGGGGGIAVRTKVAIGLHYSLGKV